MDNNQNSNNTNDDIYLITKAVDPSTISKEHIVSDLDLLNKAEAKSNYKADIAKGIKNPQIRRAVSSLKLVNPFKGY